MTSLKTLVAEMAIRGLPLTSMPLTRLQAVLILPNGLAVQCCCGWLLWPTGRVSSRGRPLHTLHSIEDAAGAARRLAQHGPGHKLSAAQAARSAGMPDIGPHSSRRPAGRVVPGLGPLEGPVMLTLWQAPEPLSVPEVSQGLGYYRPIASSTVMTVLNNLCSKNLARRLHVGRSWRYAPARSLDDYLAGRMRDLIVLAHDPETVMRNALHGRAG